MNKLLLFTVFGILLFCCTNCLKIQTTISRRFSMPGVDHVARINGKILSFNIIFVYNAIFSAPLKLSIYYETLCTDSILFFRKQLKKTHKKIGSSLIIDFVPFGLATYEKVGKNIIFHCQHGNQECNGNKYHACALAQNNGQTEDVRFLGCSMSRSYPDSRLELVKCAKRVGINFDPIEKCFNSEEGNDLLIKYSSRTQAIMSSIDRYVPTLVLNDVYNETFQAVAEFDLLKSICELLYPKPANCSRASGRSYTRREGSPYFYRGSLTSGGLF